MKYADLIVKSKEDADKALAPARANQEQAKIGISTATLSLEVKTAENELEALKSQYPLDVDSILDALDSIALQKRRLEQLQAVASELFGS